MGANNSGVTEAASSVVLIGADEANGSLEILLKRTRPNLSARCPDCHRLDWIR